MKGLLGQIGEVLEVTSMAVKLRHDDGAQHWWGHGALEHLLTAVEVDAMKVNESMHRKCGHVSQ